MFTVQGANILNQSIMSLCSSTPNWLVICQKQARYLIKEFSCAVHLSKVRYSLIVPFNMESDEQPSLPSAIETEESRSTESRQTRQSREKGLHRKKECERQQQALKTAEEREEGRAPVGGGAPERGNPPEGGVATLPTTSAGLDCGNRGS